MYSYYASRVLLIIILKRLRQYSERELPEEQTGFRAGKGTRYALFVLQLVIEKTIDTADKELYLTFIGYRKAFDMVNYKQKALQCHVEHQKLRLYLVYNRSYASLKILKFSHRCHCQISSFETE